MILYLDTSALLKYYVIEFGSAEIGRAIAEADLMGTVLIGRAEIAAALAKSTRTGILTYPEAMAALEQFNLEWDDLAHVQVTEVLVAQASAFAWEYNLRGYDAVHLAAAYAWQEAIAEPVTLATFDRQLWAAATQRGLLVFPTNETELAPA